MIFENITDFIPSLVKNVELLEEHKEHITSEWISKPLVMDVMKKHDIDSEFFKKEYAVEILKYFFSVVKKEKKVGDCPVIEKLLQYLKNKDISADELFIICTHARKAVIDEGFTQNIVSHQLISDITLLFDLNFSGVLKQYANTIYRLEKKLNEELEENHKKDNLMFEQTRLAKMGEMISMIAHQWRQPLGAISSNVIDLKMQSEFNFSNIKTEAEFKAYQKYTNHGLDEINNLVQTLTQTIDDFRNFNKPDKKSKLITLEEVFKKALSIIKTSLIIDNIKIQYDSNCVQKKEIYDSEFMQVILNIIKNSQDNFIEKDTENPSIKINISDNSISICDNGGGIPENLMDKIFDPYFSTKDEKNGTGLGLYMCKKIIEDHHSGNLKVENIDDGVCFLIHIN